jgi:hypothetical protein
MQVFQKRNEMFIMLGRHGALLAINLTPRQLIQNGKQTIRRVGETSGLTAL